VTVCIYCGLPLSGEHDGWAHAACSRVVEAGWEANYVHDSGDPDDVERLLRTAGRCPHVIKLNDRRARQSTAACRSARQATGALSTNAKPGAMRTARLMRDSPALWRSWNRRG